MTATRTVPSSLGRARRLVHPALRVAVDRLSGDVRKLSEFHLGWADVDGNPIEADTGKGVRPALALLSAEAAGAEGRVAVPGAVAVELVHNFSLIHDDVIDQDASRRHRTTVWAAFGVGPAIIAGDGLACLATEVLLDPAVENGAAAALLLCRGTTAMIAGQADDMAFESRADVSVEECLAMAGRKTGALLACASSIGSVLAGASPEVVARLEGYGMHLGLSFQAVDDILGIWGDPGVTGKPAWSDLRQRKKTLPVAAALGSEGRAARRLADMLAGGPLTETEVEKAAALVDEAGGRRVTKDLATHHLNVALDRLDHPGIAHGAAEELAGMARFVVERDF
ncbi:MAG TPA: polyprenyl synthetase family protein [Acidimicrobiales bacterium]|nr:polyprenyl synthetase family protein [Acidimicrobiales bacterium]